MRGFGRVATTIVTAAVVSFLAVYLPLELMPENNLFLLFVALALQFVVLALVVPGIAGWHIARTNARLRVVGIPLLVVGQASAFALAIIASGNSFEDPTTIIVIGLFTLIAGGFAYAVRAQAAALGD